MWRWSMALVLGVALTGCFGLLAAEPGRDGGVPEGGAPEGGDASSPDGGIPIPDASMGVDVATPTQDAGLTEAPDGQILAPDGRALSPVPVCTGSTSNCIRTATGYVGAAEVTCSGVFFVGNVTLLLELSVNGVYQIIDHQTLDAPGLGASFSETSIPANAATYRVCVVDSEGTRCGTPFSTESPPDCACEPYTCAFNQSCNITIDDGCGGTAVCGDCTNGNSCSPTTRSCCGPGLEPDGDGLCVCAPPSPCPPGEYWNVVICGCNFAGG